MCQFHANYPQITTAHSHHVQILTLTTQLESLRSTLEDKILATLNSEHELDFYAAQVRRRVREGAFFVFI